MAIKLTQGDLELISKALMSHRWSVEEQAKQPDANSAAKELFTQEFERCATLMDKLAMTNDGSILEFVHATPATNGNAKQEIPGTCTPHGR